MTELTRGEAESSAEVGVRTEKKPNGLGEQLAVFLEWVKPYKEITALAAAILTVVSGSIAWAVAHFATQAEVFYLECRINNNIETRALRDKADSVAAAIQVKNSQIVLLTEQPASDNSNITIRRLSEEINALTREQHSYSVEMKQRIDANAMRCIKEAPARQVADK